MSHTTSSIDCYCGRRAVIRTAWTDENPGRREVDVDTLIGRTLQCVVGLRVVIPGLLRKLNLVNGEVKNRKMKEEASAVNKKLERSNKMLRRLVYAMLGFFFVLRLIWISFVARKDGKESLSYSFDDSLTKNVVLFCFM
ncbi:hypothetical protein DH2020_006190 [Rehmannia glutinosa]|uniref:Uncharacterized protein n=1 Tax=Rehmannia glutinosa TaxID=99300 RepID=A0ABR0XIA0_REHGL